MSRPSSRMSSRSSCDIPWQVLSLDNYLLCKLVVSFGSNSVLASGGCDFSNYASLSIFEPLVFFVTCVNPGLCSGGLTSFSIDLESLKHLLVLLARPLSPSYYYTDPRTTRELIELINCSLGTGAISRL